MTERIEAFKPEHLDEGAHLFMTAFNAEPWNDEYTLDTAKGAVGLAPISTGMRGLGVRQRWDCGVRYRVPGANRCPGCFPPEHLLREAGCSEDEGRQQAHAYPRRASARDWGQDRLPRDP